MSTRKFVPAPPQPKSKKPIEFMSDEEKVMISAREGLLKEGLLSLIADLPEGITMIEVGCFRGDSAKLFLESGKVKKLYAVDTQCPGTWIRFAEPIFDEQVKEYDVVKLKMTMEEAVGQLPEVDFIYIDADHTYDWVKKDILSSLKVLKKGGILAGHDYAKAYENMVVKAVDEVLGVPDKNYVDTSWLKFM